MREEGIEPRDEWRTPQVRGCPAVGLNRSGSRECERGRLEEREHASYEEAPIGDDLLWAKAVRERPRQDREGTTYKRG